MNTGKGRVVEVILADGCRYARFACPRSLIPNPGQYLLATDGSDDTLSLPSRTAVLAARTVSKCSPLPVPIFYTDLAPQGFIATAQHPWNPGQELFLRGPLGRGFMLPFSARKIGLVAFDESPSYLRGLIQPALKQDASVVLVFDGNGDDLPDEVEVQPLSTLDEILQWADFIALDVDRQNLHSLMERLEKQNQLTAVRDAQILIRTPMPCGGIAECGVCAVVTKSTWQMACKDGPVFDLSSLSLW